MDWVLTNKKYVLDDFFYLSSCQEYFVCLFTCLVLKKVPFFILFVLMFVSFIKSKHMVKKYLLTLVDDYSRVTWIYLIFNKYDVMVALKQIVAFVNNQFNTCVKTDILDNGDDFF